VLVSCAWKSTFTRVQVSVSRVKNCGEISFMQSVSEDFFLHSNHTEKDFSTSSKLYGIIECSKIATKKTIGESVCTMMMQACFDQFELRVSMMKTSFS